MRTEDNSGNGSCLYYAYAISLMYHLKSLPQGDLLKQNLFDFLQLDDQEKLQIEAILNTKGHFSTTNKKIIEEILGIKLRNITANQLIEEFRTSPQGSSLYTAVAYKFRAEIQGILKASNPGIATLIGTTHPAHHSMDNFNSAEIFKVPGINLAIKTFSQQLSEDIKKIPDPTTISIDQFFSDNIIVFFKNNEEIQLNKYRQRLTHPQTWGTEEGLCALHRAITGEDIRKNTADKWEIFHHRPISLKIFNNGRAYNVGDINEINSNIIIDNRMNNHWISQISARTDLDIFIAEGNELLEEIRALNNAITTGLTDYLQKLSPPNFRPKKNNFVTKTMALNEALSTILLNQLQNDKTLDIKKTVYYKQLFATNELVHYLINDTNNHDDKITALKNYEKQAKSNTSVWISLGKLIVGFVLAAAAAISGAAIGAVIGVSLSSITGPGIIIGIGAGAITGAVIGATAVFGLFKTTSHDEPIENFYDAAAKIC